MEAVLQSGATSRGKKLESAMNTRGLEVALNVFEFGIGPCRNLARETRSWPSEQQLPDTISLGTVTIQMCTPLHDEEWRTSSDIRNTC